MAPNNGWLTAQWVQRGLDALKATLDTSAELKSEMIEFLFEAGFWDSSKLSFPAATARFNACMNPERRSEFFKVGEIWALMKRFNRHQFFLAMADDLGYRVERIPTDELRLRAMERIADALEEHNTIQQRALEQVTDATAIINQLETAGPKQRIHPAVREGGSFDLAEHAGSRFGYFEQEPDPDHASLASGF